MTSYSEVQLYARCRLAWWFRYRARLRPVERTDCARLLGRAFHKAVEDRNSRTPQSPYWTVEFLGLGAQYIRDRTTMEVLEGWTAEWGQYDPEGALSVMLEMLDLSTADPASTEDRMADVQVEVDVQHDDITGRVDLLYRIDEGGPLVLRDWKTSNRLDAVQAVMAPQLPVYGWLVQEMTGESPMWVEVVQVSNVPSAEPKLTKPTKPTKANPEGRPARLAKTPNRYTPHVYETWCVANGIEPDPAELDRLRSPAHVAGFVQTARRLLTDQSVASARDWMLFYRDEMTREHRRPQGCRDPKVCSMCDYASVCLDLQDTGSVKPAAEYGMEIVE